MQSMTPDRAAAWRSLRLQTLQTLLALVVGSVTVAIAYDLPLIWTGVMACVGAASTAFSIGVAKGLIFPKRGRGRWDFEAMQPRGGSQLRPVPRVDWVAHSEDQVFLHTHNLSSDAIHFHCSAQCVVVPGRVLDKLVVLREHSLIWERNGADLYAEFDQGPNGSDSTEGARVWASERNGVSRIVVAYGGVSSEISDTSDARVYSDPVLQAASSREWFETLVKLAVPGDTALHAAAERVSLPAEESSEGHNSSYTTNFMKKSFYLLGVLFVIGTMIVFLFEPVLEHFGLGVKDADRGGGALIVSSQIANEWAKTSPHTGAESFKAVAEGVSRPASVSIEVQGSEAHIHSSTDKCVVRAEDDTYASVSCQTL